MVSGSAPPGDVRDIELSIDTRTAIQSECAHFPVLGFRQKLGPSIDDFCPILVIFLCPTFSTPVACRIAAAASEWLVQKVMPSGFRLGLT